MISDADTDAGVQVYTTPFALRGERVIVGVKNVNAVGRVGQYRVGGHLGLARPFFQINCALIFDVEQVETDLHRVGPLQIYRSALV